MANPQREDGHVDIANEIVEALAKTYLSSYESQVLWAIFRKTYGWHKKEDWITNTQISDMTGIAESHISRTIKKLIQRKIIIKVDKKIAFQKDYDQWEKLPIQDTKLPKQVIKVTQIGHKVTQIGIHKRNYTKETLTKETIQKTLSHKFFEKNSVTYQLTIYLEGKIIENNKSIQKKSESQIQKWCNDFDKLIRLDKAKPEEIKKIIDWVVQDDFWCKNILCPASLRKHYPRFYKEVIDRGRSLEEKIAADHRLDGVD